MTNQQDKCRAFEALHRQAGAFVIANPYDLGSARVLESLGFLALATTSAGLAQTLGRADGHVTLEEKLAHCRLLAAATKVPINVDFEDGFAEDPEGVAANVLRLAETGVAGSSIEDFARTGRRIFDATLAVERVHAAAEAVASLGMPFQLTARAEGLLRRTGGIDEVIDRLRAFEAAGAHVLYAPGLRTLDEVRLVRAAVTRPLNVLAPLLPGTTVAELAAAGAQRISVGSALAALSMAPVIDAGREMLGSGTFTWLKDMPADLPKLLSG